MSADKQLATFIKAPTIPSRGGGKHGHTRPPQTQTHQFVSIPGIPLDTGGREPARATGRARGSLTVLLSGATAGL